jgi:N-acetylneuraminic acid mutarotase
MLFQHPKLMKKLKLLYIVFYFGLSSCGSNTIPSPWKIISPMPDQRMRQEAFLGFDGNIQVFGGISNPRLESTSNDFDDPDSFHQSTDAERWFLTYDDTLNRWKTKPMQLAPSSDFLLLYRDAAVICNAQGELYWIGGAGKESEKSVRILKAESNTSTFAKPEKVRATLIDKPPLGEAREQHEAVQTRDGKIWVFGGMKHYIETKHYGSTISSSEVNIPLNSVECFDAKMNCWKYKAAMIHPRLASAAVILEDGQIMVCGGLNGKSSSYGGSIHALASVELYDPVRDRWQELAPMPQSRFAHAAVRAPDGRIWVIGGADLVDTEKSINNIKFTVHRTVFIYDPRANHWGLGPEMNFGRRNCSAVCTSAGRIYAMGGSDYGYYETRTIHGFNVPLRHFAGSILASVEIFDTNTWMERK